MLKTELITREGYLVNSGIVGRSPTTYFYGLRHRMAIGSKIDRRLSLQADPKIYISMAYNIHRICKEGKDRVSLCSNISEDRQINRGLIVWISGFKSDRRLSLRSDSKFYKLMAYNPYQIREPGKMSACCQGDIINDRWVLRDLDRKDIRFKHGRRLCPRTNPKFYMLTIYFLCQLCKVGKGRASL